MQDWLTHRARVSPHKLALIFEDRRWTYAELDAAANDLCATLTAAGARPGDHVAALLPNCPAFVFLIHALARLGAVLVPLNTRLTGDELRRQVRQADVSRLVCNAHTADIAARLDVPTVNVQSAVAGPPPAAPVRPLNMDAVQAIVFTSGTTGQPKGAMLTFANHYHSATASAFRLGVDPADCWLLAMPLYHVGGMAIVLRSCLYGTAILLQSKFEAETTARALRQQPVTLISVVPTMLHRMLKNDPNVLASPHLRVILVGGAAMSPQLAEICRELNLPVAVTYGLTEAASQVATAAPDEARRKPGSVGKPLLFSAVRVADPDGNSLPAGEIGEIVVSGPTVMAGYYRRPDATRQALRHGELFTGDLGYLDADGDLFVVQRRSDLIISGGENVYPAEVERVLRGHPAVADTCVVGLPDPEWGQRVAAMVICTEPLAESALPNFCRQQLGGHKQPRLFKFVESLPLTASGKVHRDAVRRQLELENDNPDKH